MAEYGQAEPNGSTFAKLLSEYIAAGVIGLDDAVFVQFGGAFDQKVCDLVGLTNVTLANIASDALSVGDADTSMMDAHRVPLPDASFDHVICHSGLHHCSRPHEALHEMYRLARKTVMFVENQDSLLMRLATKLGVVSWHELVAVIGEGYTTGGVDGTAVPNFVYRWTKRELRKAVASFDPAYDVPIEFYTEWNLGTNRPQVHKLQQKFHLTQEQAERVFLGGQRFMNLIAGGQGNIFAATIRRDKARLHEWMSSPTEMKRIEQLS